MIGLFVWGAMYLARTVEYAVQAGWSLIVPFVGLFPLAGLGAAESGVNCSVIGIIAIASAFVFAALGLVVAVFGLGGAFLAGRIFTTGQPAILTHTKAGHKCREGYHGFRLFLAEVAGEPFITDVVFEGR